MRIFNVELKGQTPLLMKRKIWELITKERLPHGHPLRSLIKGETVTSQDIKRPEVAKAIADLAAYRNGHGLFMPSVAIRHSLIEGARKGKVKGSIGRSMIWTKLSGTIFPTPGEVPIMRNGEKLDNYDQLKQSLVRGLAGVMPQYQAQVDVPWDAGLQLLVLDETLTETILEDMLGCAGLYAGLGAWVSGGFGRYSLARFEEGPLPAVDQIAGLLQPA